MIAIARTSRSALAGAALLLAAAVAPLPVQAQDAEALRDQYVADLEGMQSKFIELAGAMGEDSYGWAPMDGVRTVSQVYMLIAAENYLVPTAWGVDAPEGVPGPPAGFRELAAVTGKSEVLAHLEASFEHALAAVGSLTPEEFGRTIQFFGQDRTVQESIHLILGDMHEHLGQAIAYARMNEVVPPWTARQQAGG